MSDAISWQHSVNLICHTGLEGCTSMTKIIIVFILVNIAIMIISQDYSLTLGTCIFFLSLREKKQTKNLSLTLDFTLSTLLGRPVHQLVNA